MVNEENTDDIVNYPNNNDDPLSHIGARIDPGSLNFNGVKKNSEESAADKEAAKEALERIEYYKQTIEFCKPIHKKMYSTMCSTEQRSQRSAFMDGFSISLPSPGELWEKVKKTEKKIFKKTGDALNDIADEGKSLSNDVTKIGKDVANLGMDLGQTGMDLFKGHFSVLGKDVGKVKHDLEKFKNDFAGLKDDAWKKLAEKLIEPYHDIVKNIFSSCQSEKSNNKSGWNKSWGDLMTAVHAPKANETVLTSNANSAPLDSNKSESNQPDLFSALKGLGDYISKGEDWVAAQDFSLVFGLTADVSFVAGASVAIGGVLSFEGKVAGFESVGLSAGLQEGGSAGVLVGVRRGFETTFGPSIALALHLTIEAGIAVIVYVWPSFLTVKGPWEDGGAGIESSVEWHELMIDPLGQFSPDDIQGFDVIIDGGEDLGFSFGTGFTLEFPPEDS